MKKIILLLAMLLPILSYGQFDGRGNFHADTVRLTAVFGAYDCATYAAGNDYQAPADGFVVATALLLPDATYMVGYTDAAATPTTQIAKCGFDVTGAETMDCTITFPVKKGDYFKVTDCTTICYLPFKY